jgi:hypothetical protein
MKKIFLFMKIVLPVFPGGNLQEHSAPDPALPHAAAHAGRLCVRGVNMWR